jgi:hypothetical protein
MAGKREDVSFGFDPRPFLNGLSQVQRGMGDLTKRVGLVAGQMTRRLLAVGGAILGLRAGFRSMMQNIPEIGQAFKIAGDIFTKNFFWPLRQAVMPLLMKMLDWVRTHRATFVKWGAAVVSVFRMAASVVRGVYDILTKIVGSLGPSFRNLFKGGIADFLNLMSLKLAFVMQLIVGLIEKVVSGFGKGLGGAWDKIKDIAKAIWDFAESMLKANATGASLGTVLKTIAEIFGQIIDIGTTILKPFIEGLVSPLKNIMTPFQGVATAIRNLLGSIKGLMGDKDTQGFLNFLGKITGTAIITGLTAVAVAIGGVVSAIQWLIFAIKSYGNAQKASQLAIAGGKSWGEAFEAFSSILTASGEEAKALAEQQKNMFGPMFTGLAESYKGTWAGEPTQAHDVVITKRGEVVQLDPGDTIMAAKKLGGLGGGLNVEVNLTVTEGNARAAGMSFASGLADQLRNAVLAEQVAGGY